MAHASIVRGPFWFAVCELLAEVTRLREDAARLWLAERVLRGFENVPCLRDLPGEDDEGCECMGCASRAYFRAARAPAPEVSR